jgi:hypothetical protein
MKITAFLSIFLTYFPLIGFAQDELVMQKEFMYWESTISDSSCNQLIYIELGRDVPDLREEPCGNINGKFSLTLSGPPGTTLTLFGDYDYNKENGFLIIRKIDDQQLWLLDLIAFPAGQWFSSKDNKNSGAFETFYNPSPTFEESISSLKWGSNSH